MKNLIKRIRKDIKTLTEELQTREQRFITDGDIVDWLKDEIGDEDMDIILEGPTVKCNSRHGEVMEFTIAKLKDGLITGYGISEIGYHDRETFELDELTIDELIALGNSIRDYGKKV